MRLLAILRAVAIAAAFPALWAAEPPAAKSVLVTNNDPAIISPPLENGVSFFSMGANGGLARIATVQTGGYGVGGGYFGASRILVTPGTADFCIFAANTASPDVVGIDGNTRTLTGPFFPGPNDSANLNGMSLASNGSYLYVTFTTSSTIAAFQIQPGCQLSYFDSTFAVGLNHGIVTGIAVHGNMLVAAYGDGSIESFNVSGGTPVSNSDKQFSTAYASDNLANGVDITKDGRFAIFGDSSTVTTVEVSDISSGVLTPTVVYNLGPAWNSTSVRLSPDETILYISNNSSGQVTAAFFNSATGVISRGCSSSRLKGFYSSWSYAGNTVAQFATGLGGAIYVPEFGSSGISSIGVVSLAVNGATCTITESAKSPVSLNAISNLLSIGVYPPRPF